MEGRKFKLFRKLTAQHCFKTFPRSFVCAGTVPNYSTEAWPARANRVNERPLAPGNLAHFTDAAFQPFAPDTSSAFQARQTNCASQHMSVGALANHGSRHADERTFGSMGEWTFEMTRVAIVTGGTRGIGEAISLKLKELGCTVVANYAGNVEKAKAFTATTGIPAFRWDVGDHEACFHNCVDIAAKIGPIDILVNNAGVTRDGTLHKMSFDDWNEVMRINLGGCFNMAKATFPGMRQRAWGRIINIGSINGQAGQYGQVNYAAAKSGIHGFTKALAQEGAKFGVTVNAIAPGYVDTDMVAAVPDVVLEKIIATIPVGRLGRTEEIARGVAFLASEDGAFITGSTLSINGGQHMY